jgi:type I restriction enzyme, S subunit
VNKSWPTIPLKEVLTKADEWIDIKPDEQYQEVTVRLWGKGVVKRREVVGAEIAATRRQAVRPQQFILSRIDARNGAFGLVPDVLDGAIVSNDFPVFDLNHSQIVPRFLGWMSKTGWFVDLCKKASEGTTNRVRLKEDRFLEAEIPIPPLPEQQRIVARIEELAAKIEEAYKLKQAVKATENQMLSVVFSKLIADSMLQRMEKAAPITRRPIKVEIDGTYPELGIRSFGKGTFHKPTLNGVEVGTKKLFYIKPDDLVFNNVFAWEGAVAVATSEDVDRVGSHRFITCVPKKGVATANFLCFYFLTEEGLKKLGDASPGGAGRNRTLGLETLSAIEVPIPSYEKQLWFDDLQMKVNALRRLQSETATELNAMLPSFLDKVFKGEILYDKD